MIEVGEYIRTTEGCIVKIKNDEHLDFLKFSNAVIGDITKHSKNIIDLIEVGDYVNGILINYMPKDEHKIYHDAYDMYDVYAFSNKDIETILTHEQYEQNCYKIGE